MKSRKNSSITVNGKDAGVTSSLGIASVLALTGVSLMASNAEAQTAAGLAGVQSATVGADGVLTLLLENGSQLLIQAAEFTVAANGSIVLSEVALAQVAQALAAAGGAAAGTGLLAAGAVAGVVSEVAEPAPEEAPNTPAVIGGALAGAVSEDVAVVDGNITASGTLTVTDADAGQAVFVAQTSAAGTYGSFTLATNGAWTYSANNSQTAIQALGPNNSLTDSFTAVTADGTAQVVTITINGTAEPIPAVQLSAVEAGIGGFVINGVSAYDTSGRSVSNAGDVNGDGLDDLIIGADGDDPNGSNSGASFVVFGKTDGGPVQLSNIEAGIGGFVINGVSAYDNSGVSVSAAGDVNGDGLDDLIVGADSDDPNGGYSGASFVVFGKTSGAAVQLSTIEAGTGGFVINGVSAYDTSGRSVSNAGDVNGDGLDDLIIGAIGDDPNGRDSGASFVVFGKTDGGPVQLSNIEAGIGGFVINGVSAYDTSGRSVSSAGDVNGDGLDDLIIGANFDDPNGGNSGASFVVFGKTSGAAVQLSTIEAGIGGFVINGVSAYDTSGRSVSNAGDVNGDGLDDLIIGAYGDDPNGSSSGASFVVFGKTSGAAVQLSTIEAGIGGFVINGVSAFDQSGFSVSAAGDVNGDGLDDLIIGAYLDDPNGSNSGASFVVFGKTNGAAVQLSTIEAGIGGFVINGVSAGDVSGASVSAAGDVNGDGFDDLIVGAPNDDPNGGNSGASFVVFGGDFSGLATRIGTVGDDTLTGTTGADNLIGGAGNDTVRGSGGADVLLGGAGNDRVEISDLSFARIDGGNGFDTLVLARPGLTLDLTTLDNTSLNGIEQIDLDSFSNALVLNKLEVLRLSDTTNTLRVLGSSGDRLTVTDSGWVKGVAFFDPSAQRTFDVYTNGNATLEVGTGVQVFGLPIPAVQLSAVEAGIGGFVINGVSADDLSGDSVSSAGDVNGDGLDDLIIGASGDDPNGTDSGASFVVFGKTSGAAVQLSTIEAGIGGFVINGVSRNDYSGASVSAAGDVNGDGLDDLIIGARYDGPNGVQSGASFVVFGKTSGAAVQLSTIEAGIGGFVINGVSRYDYSGRSVSNAGDVNGDGFDDLIIGADGDDPNGSYSGASFVVFGKTDGGPVHLSNIEAGNGGFVINGVSRYDNSGRSVSNAGDVNGDGFDDLIIGASGDDPNGGTSGASFVVFGKTSGAAVQLSTIEAGIGGFVINGVSAYDNSGVSVSAAGDVNGDGLYDLIVGAPNDDPNGSYSGASFVVFGKTSGAAVQLSTIEAGIGGFVINGVSAFDNSGRSVSNAGDVNGDGLDDLIVGAYQDNPNGFDSGASFVVFGKTDGAAVQLSTIEAGIGGFVINGVSERDFSGSSVSNAGDVNGDGFDDLIIGADSDDPNGSDSGASFVVFGGNLTGAVTVLGTANAEGLDGTSGADVIFGAQGNDRLNGGGGNDRLSGGSGADIFEVRDLAGTITIIDFTAQEGDRLDVIAFGYANFAAFAATLSESGQGGHDLRAQLDSDTSIIFQGLGLGDLTENNVILSARNDV
jgi:VCBS repeat-containing protein